LGLRYAPTDLNLKPLDMGFVVQRQYEAIDHPEDVSRDANGVWHIKAGARVRVRITMVADNRRYHVALDDPLPAGLEIVNPDLAVSGSTPQDPTSASSKYGWWWWSTWYEHQNMRDERAEAFTSLLWDGVYDYTYVARATTPGTFIAPPAKAEEMYSPEVFGRSGSDWVTVEPK
jgi:alpha-2-macroglobulin